MLGVGQEFPHAVRVHLGLPNLVQIPCIEIGQVHDASNLQTQGPSLSGTGQDLDCERDTIDGQLQSPVTIRATQTVPARGEGRCQRFGRTVEV